MREIKFRAWDMVDHKMRIVVSIFGFNESSRNHLGLLPSTRRRRTSCVLMQFTGLLDKNGTKIFDGDIIETDGSSLGREVVEYYEAQYAALLWAGDQGMKEPNRIEVIGNIYENPELLK